MSKIDDKIVSISEDVETQKLEDVWTVGKKFMFAIIGGLALIIVNGIFSIYYSNEIVKSSNYVIDHAFKMRELGLEMSSYVNRHKAALAVYSITKEEGTKTELIDIRSKLVEINNTLKQNTITEDEEARISRVSELLNTALNTGQNFLSLVDKSKNENSQQVIPSKVIEPKEPKSQPVKKEVKEESSDDLLSDMDDLLAGLDDLDDLDDLEGLDDLSGIGENTSTNDKEIEINFDMDALDFGGTSSSKDQTVSNMRDYNLSVLELINAISDEILIPLNTSTKIKKSIIENDFLILKFVQIGFRVVIIIYFIFIFYFFEKGITKPIKSLRRYLISMGRGELPEFKMKIWKDDIGEMVRSVKELLIGLKGTALFAKELGSGNLQANYNLLSQNDILGNALMDMRDSLRKVADDDKKRNWVNQGVATFSEILRKNNDNLEVLTDQIILYLVNYLSVNQGAIFLVNDINKKDIHLELAAIYAWDRKKFLEQRIEKGQGLVGQCWYEQKTIFMTDVPENFVRITSGLGEATPKCVLIVPLVSNEEIYGILEFASFKVLEQYEIEYVEKVAESIGAAIGNVRITERTKTLLEEAQQQGEELRANEEEMRQNMEEMNATQEEMDRVLQEKDQQIERLIEELNALKK